MCERGVVYGFRRIIMLTYFLSITAAYEMCDFESAGICGWTQQVNDDFDWSRTKGPSDGDLSTGPLRDHTLGTPQGKYM